jgi:hypothetical protein
MPFPTAPATQDKVCAIGPGNIGVIAVVAIQRTGEYTSAQDHAGLLPAKCEVEPFGPEKVDIQFVERKLSVFEAILLRDGTVSDPLEIAIFRGATAGHPGADADQVR